jgi:uncharacterized protein YbjT (DUF2867 family)
MATRRVATVFGGSGFIGRYVVQRLAALGYVVRVAGRDPERALFLKTAGAVGQIVPLYVSFGKEATVRRAVEEAAVVINLVGILAERHRGDFVRVQAEGPGLIAKLAAAEGVQHMVQMSAIGADPNSRSLYAKTKAGGEAAVRSEFPAATILRPSIVFGPEDQFFNRFAGMARLSPIMPVFAGNTRFQPVYVGDVADAVIASLSRADTAGGLYELGGPRVLTFREVLNYVMEVIGRQRRLIDVPMPLARLQALFLEHLPGKLLTTDQLILLQKDNVVAPGAPGLADLGIVPTPIETVVPSYLRRYAPGGGRRLISPENGSESGLSSERQSVAA